MDLPQCLRSVAVDGNTGQIDLIKFS